MGLKCQIQSTSPENAKFSSLQEMFMLPVILFVFGGVFLVVGIVIQFPAEPSNKNKKSSRTNV